MSAAVAAVEEAEGGIGALVNNAGYSQNGAVETVPLADVRAQFETNVFGLLRMCQLVLPGMRRRGEGTIVNMSSMGGRLTFPGGGIYHATKHAVEAISDAMRFEVSGFGVHVVVIEPGIIRSSFGETAAGSVSAGDGPYAEFNAAVAEANATASDGPLGKLGGEPDDVAKVIEAAIAARRPRTRYRVTASARVSAHPAEAAAGPSLGPGDERRLPASVDSRRPYRKEERLKRALFQGRGRGVRVHRQAVRGACTRTRSSPPSSARRTRSSSTSTASPSRR